MKQTTILEKYCKCFLFIFGTVLTLFGSILRFNIPSFHDYVINSALDVRPGSKAYDAWRTNDPPLILDMYLFNWTNAADVYNSSIKPRFEQVGPYRFKEVKEKYNITFHENNTVSFQYVKRYYFMEEDSPKPLTEVINTLNPVATSVAYKQRFANSFSKFGVSFAISSTSRIYVTKTIDELLFSGYQDDLLDFLRPIAPLFGENGTIEDKFGWFYKRNDTYGISGDFSMYTSHDENFGRLHTWNYSNRTTFYEGKCGAIHGSAGEFHPLNRERNSIEIYSSEMCSYASLEYERDDVVKGVKAYRYAANTLFDNGTKVPDNACYCNGECIPSGVLNISSCRMNAPIFLSLPHFYNADPYYTEIIDGMQPSKEKHDFYITLEPKSAIVVDLSARMQLNVLLQPIDGVSLFDGVPKIFVPIFFFDQIVTMDDELAMSISLLQNLPEISKFAAYIMITLGGLLMIIVIMIHVICPVSKNKSKKNEYRIAQTTLMTEEIPLRIKNEF